MSSQEEKAKALIAQAEKKLKGFSFFGGGSKNEEAAELYQQAGNLLKMGKKWNEAGEAFLRAADLMSKSNGKHEMAQMYTEAANSFKKCDPERAIECMSSAVEMFTDLGRFAIAAKYQVNIAEICESDLANVERAITHYQTAADWYQMEESNAAANKCLLKVALFSAQLKRFEEAISIYEQVGYAAIENTLLKYSAKEYFLRAGLCHLATGDFITAQRAVDGYVEKFVSFQDTRECKLLQDLLANCVDEVNVEGFTAVVADYDSVSRLDAWYTSILLHIKKSLNDEPALM